MPIIHEVKSGECGVHEIPPDPHDFGVGTVFACGNCGQRYEVYLANRHIPPHDFSHMWVPMHPRCSCCHQPHGMCCCFGIPESEQPKAQEPLIVAPGAPQVIAVSGIIDASAQFPGEK